MKKPYPPYDSIPVTTVHAVEDLLVRVGMSTHDQHTEMTAARLTYYLSHWFRPVKETRFTTFENECPVVDQMIVVAPIHFWACCSHHMLPFFGTVAFGYIPDQRLVGLSMVPLLVKEFCTRPWLQEAMTTQLGDFFQETLRPIGLGIVTKATHTCQMLDLGGPPVPEMVFSDLRGALRESDRARAEFYSLIGGE